MNRTFGPDSARWSAIICVVSVGHTPWHRVKMKVKKLLDSEELESLAEAMQEMETELKGEGEPRQMVPQETERAAPI